MTRESGDFYSKIKDAKKLLVLDLGFLGDTIHMLPASQLHMGGDSGSLHVALMMNKPTFSWFREYVGKIEWLPMGSNHKHIIGEKSPDGLKKISAEDLFNLFQS